MKAKIEFEQLYKDIFTMETKKEIVAFFKEMKDMVCNDLQNRHTAMLSLYPERPIVEKVTIEVVSSHYEAKENGYRYHGIFKVQGVYSRSCYDRIEVELEDVDFLKKVPSIDDYLLIMFKMRYSGRLMAIEDVMEYACLSKKAFENNRMISLCKIDEVAAKERETHTDKVSRLAIELARLVGKKPFEVYYGLGTMEQRVLYSYDEKEHFSYLSYLVDRTRTHDVKIRIIDNEIAEWFKLTKGLYETKIRKLA